LALCRLRAAAQEAEHLDGVFRPDHIGVADDQQGGGPQAGELFPGPGDADAIELVHLADERNPGVRVGRDAAVGLARSLTSAG
jgi:hypothetical protein